MFDETQGSAQTGSASASASSTAADIIAKFNQDHLERFSDINLIRRHSWSSRAPQPVSINDEIISLSRQARSGQLEKSNHLLAEIQHLRQESERLSDFGSCMSDVVSSSDGEDNSAKK